MKTASEYRAMADECFQWARKASSDNERKQYLDLANAWVQAASLQDGKLPTAPTR